MWIFLMLIFAAEPVPAPALETLDEIRIRDPFVLPVKETGVYYLYGTGWPLGEPGFDAYKSRDLKHWEGPFSVFRSDKDYWGQKDFWAPEVHPYKGRYYMFATFSPKSDGYRGTAILVADSPEGPFLPHSEGPVTPPDWAALDGTLFIDDEAQPWMVFCHEWEQIGDGAICAIRLSEDLARSEGAPATLFHASAAVWVNGAEFGNRKGLITDGPWLHRNQDGSLLMLWSSFGKDRQYMTAIARSASGKIIGPWAVSSSTIFEKDGGHAMLFQSFEGTQVLSLHQPNGKPKERAKFFTVDFSNNEIRLKAPLLSEITGSRQKETTSLP
ncbi:MAG TPA: glycoside hydrolase family 43 protein [Candidatus Hydrogenedentes bacterium]|mgnify:CR=1 FL=1|nr:glycoside hydrolase family 43 protein [Candidatus Hydrogenedentota bacterium]